MAYSQGGLIEATDYNNIAANVNTIWGVGAGSNGYGQSTTISNVSAAGTVSNTEWQTMITRLDSIRQHQALSNSGVTKPVAGDTITYTAAIVTLTNSTNGTIFTNKLAAATVGTALPTGIGNPQISNATSWITSAVKEATVTFSNTNTVRYFFNAGGRVTFYLTMTGGTTTKTTDWASFLTNQVGTITLGNNFCSRSGTGGDNLTQNTSIGYHQLTTTYQTLFAIGSTSATADYGNNSILIEARVNGALYGASSNIVSIRCTLTDAAGDTFNDTINGTLGLFIGYTPPETTNLSNVWGTPTGATVTNTQS